MTGKETKANRKKGGIKNVEKVHGLYLFQPSLDSLRRICKKM